MGDWRSDEDGHGNRRRLSTKKIINFVVFLVILGIRSHYTDSSKIIGDTSTYAQGTDKLKVPLFL